jgi:hypothetical protein
MSLIRKILESNNISRIVLEYDPAVVSKNIADYNKDVFTKNKIPRITQPPPTDIKLIYKTALSNLKLYPWLSAIRDTKDDVSTGGLVMTGQSATLEKKIAVVIVDNSPSEFIGLQILLVKRIIGVFGFNEKFKKKCITDIIMVGTNGKGPRSLVLMTGAASRTSALVGGSPYPNLAAACSTVIVAKNTDLSSEVACVAIISDFDFRPGKNKLVGEVDNYGKQDSLIDLIKDCPVLLMTTYKGDDAKKMELIDSFKAANPNLSYTILNLKL